MPPFVRALELPDYVPNIDPSVDIHFEIEFLGRMPKDECELPCNAVSFSRTHDELTLRIAGWTKVIIREISVN